jgi:hypothetical protein
VTSNSVDPPPASQKPSKLTCAAHPLHGCDCRALLAVNPPSFAAVYTHYLNGTNLGDRQNGRRAQPLSVAMRPGEWFYDLGKVRVWS